MTITLPWIPGLSSKLRRPFRKAGYKCVFKSNMNIGTMITKSNKQKLPPNSYPGIYKIPCENSENHKPYIGETKLKVSTRVDQHQNKLNKQIWDYSGVTKHGQKCKYDFSKAATLKIEPNRFNRKVRESLEIQLTQCGPNHGGPNLDNGQYVSTLFWNPMLDRIRQSNIRT